MKYRLEYISTFHAEIPPIADYLAEYPAKAARVFAKMDKILGTLQDMPELYPVYHDAPNFRFFTVEDYLVLYKVKNPEAVVEVHHLLHGRIDILSRLEKLR